MKNLESDLSFCNTCTVRGEIGPDTLCARQALVFLQQIAQRGDALVFDVETDELKPVDPGDVPYGEYYVQGALRCISSVSQGGRPIAASEELDLDS
jgi:hypothetical protein